jgi:hypothetical protein
VHKLQLVSGRALMEVRAPERSGAVRFVALTVATDGTVYALDAAGSRVFRARPGTRTFEQIVRLDGDGHAALTMAGDGAIYVAGGAHVLRIDLSSRSTSAVKSPDDLTGLVSIAWHAGDLVGIARSADTFDIVRVKLDSGGSRVVSRQVLASSPASTVGSLAGDSFYYLANDATIRRLSLR